MDEKVYKQVQKLKKEQTKLYQKYYDGKATKKDIRRIDEITCHLSEILGA